jgi:hypothetical protein
MNWKLLVDAGFLYSTALVMGVMVREMTKWTPCTYSRASQIVVVTIFH